MPTREKISERLATRLRHVARDFDDSKTRQLVEYFYHLAKWNGQMNLTSLDIDGPSEEALDRLIVEPILASRFVPSDTKLHVDLGSGGGSPAIPLRIATDLPQLVMIESKTRKCAFLREVVRQLGLTGVVVENARFESLAGRQEFNRRADLVSFRAVRTDKDFWRMLIGLLKPGGKVLWFGAPASFEIATGLRVDSTHELIQSEVADRKNLLAILSAT